MTEGARLDIRVPGGDGYPLEIRAGGLKGLGALCRERAPAHRYAVISDSQVARLLGAKALEALGPDADARLLTFPAGEWNKSREEWASLTDMLLAAGFGRDTTIVALGGGVTGDLAGFVAATYMRGVPVVQVPTTLLAMLDSSVGGKTGVDTEAGKNLIGAFHHPSAVLIDPETLATLPKHQRVSGLAEAVKTAAILDADLWTWIESRTEALVAGEVEATAELIRRVVRHKADVVEGDPVEAGRRAILNFGHTIGHAIEALEGYTVLHGEAVAAGMRAEARLGEALGVTAPGTAARIVDVLEACGLGREWEEERRVEEIRERMALDKKARGARIRCVFLSAIGTVARDPEGRWTFALEGDDLDRSLEAALRPASEA